MQAYSTGGYRVHRLPREAIRLSEPERRTFAALVAVWQRDGRCTVRAVAAEAQRSVSTTYGQLVVLGRKGLVGGVEQDGHEGALRPLMVPVAVG